MLIFRCCCTEDYLEDIDVFHVFDLLNIGLETRGHQQ